ncbi:uncharacterized protein LOC116121860 [Pistacia vera]|uniref:uncharacterized protein LOC116121860 n=1 Tax=Pistacia vera TaxID=55513 RepID=UPI0012634377|nr:uncharacterized protein LOC116121860 [Pistacia vera]
MEVYIDNMLVKSLIAEQHPDHLNQAFTVPRKYNMKLNPAKCSFRVSSGKFLGYMVTQRGIEANPNQIRAILSIPSLTCIKNVQHLAERVAALSCFISRSTDKCHLFFHALKKTKKFQWIASCEEALQQLKRYLTSPPLLSKPVDGEKLYSYIAVSETAISAILVREEETKQLSVYYILHKPKLLGRLLQWTVELSEFDISYQPRIAVKSLALADFITDFTPTTTTQAKSELLCMNDRPPSKWTLLVDGSSNVNRSGLGLVLIMPEGDMIQRAIQYGFKCTNNEAEYEALIARLSLAKEIRAKRLEVKSDSQLVVNQLQGTYQTRDSKMTSYLSMVNELQAQFDEFSIVQIPRAENSYADALDNLNSDLKCSSQSFIPLLFM